MTPEEFERLKEQEKAHLRQLRDLKAQHRDVQRKKSIFDALRGLTRPDIDATHEEQVGKLMQDAAMSEARLDLAMESASAGESATERAAREAEAREALRRAEAAELVRQMKAEVQGPPAPAGGAGAAEAGVRAAGKSIGRVSLDEGDDAPAAAAGSRGAKSIGRPAPPDA